GREPLATPATPVALAFSPLGAIAAQALAWEIAGIATSVSALVSLDNQDRRTGVERAFALPVAKADNSDGEKPAFRRGICHGRSRRSDDHSPSQPSVFPRARYWTAPSGAPRSDACYRQGAHARHLRAPRAPRGTAAGGRGGGDRASAHP